MPTTRQVHLFVLTPKHDKPPKHKCHQDYCPPIMQTKLITGSNAGYSSPSQYAIRTTSDKPAAQLAPSRSVTKIYRIYVNRSATNHGLSPSLTLSSNWTRKCRMIWAKKNSQFLKWLCRLRFIRRLWLRMWKWWQPTKAEICGGWIWGEQNKIVLSERLCSCIPAGSLFQ